MSFSLMCKYPACTGAPHSFVLLCPEVSGWAGQGQALTQAPGAPQAAFTHGSMVQVSGCFHFTPVFI